MTTDDTRDLVTTILRAVKQLLIETAGQATDLDLLNLEQRIRQEYAGCREYIAGRLPATRRYEAILQDLDAGIPERDVASLHQVSDRTIRRARQSGQRRP